MDFQNGIFIAIAIVCIVLLVTFLVTVFYKPKKRLQVKVGFDHGSQHVLKVDVLNIGKRKLKMVAPYIKFTHGRKSRKYQVDPRKIKCKFPRALKVGEEFSCFIDLEHFHSVLEKRNMKSTHVKVIIENMVGMKYISHTVDYKF